MANSSFKIDKEETENNIKQFNFLGDFNQSDIEELTSFIASSLLLEKNIILDFNKTSGIDLSSLQIVISAIKERNSSEFQTSYQITDNKELLGFFNKTGICNLLDTLTNKASI